jgi:ABC-type lipoprotein export system ATPase subunit
VTGPTLDAQNLAFRYPGADAPLFHDFRLAVSAGEMVAVSGRSGAGKSTLLYLLGLFIEPTAGRISLAGLETTRLGDAERSRLRAHRIGFVFQDAALDAGLTVEENVAEGAVYGGLSYREAIAGARDLLAAYGIAELATRRPTRISGGQAQRTALCRALLRRPSLVLADEPTGNLDPANAEAVMAGLRAAAVAGAAVLIVTHSPSVAEVCDRAIALA